MARVYQWTAAAMVVEIAAVLFVYALARGWI